MKLPESSQLNISGMKEGGQYASKGLILSIWYLVLIIAVSVAYEGRASDTISGVYNLAERASTYFTSDRLGEELVEDDEVDRLTIRHSLKKADFEDAHELAKYAATAEISLSEFEKQFKYLKKNLSTESVAEAAKRYDAAAFQ